MNKDNAMRLFRQFSLIGCRGFCRAPGAAHSNLSNYAFFSNTRHVFPLQYFAYSAFFIMLLKIYVVCEFANRPLPVIMGQMPFVETPAFYNDSRKSSRLFYCRFYNNGEPGEK